jgi:hypothetical protein
MCAAASRTGQAHLTDLNLMLSRHGNGSYAGKQAFVHNLHKQPQQEFRKETLGNGNILSVPKSCRCEVELAVRAAVCSQNRLTRCGTFGRLTDPAPGWLPGAGCTTALCDLLLDS